MSNVKDCEEPAILANISFNERDYSNSLKQLNNLETVVGNNNRRLQHNKTVVEFMSGDMKNIEMFKKNVTLFINLSFPETEIKDLSLCYELYNYAILLYHSRYYYQCTIVLEKLLNSGNVKDSKLLQCTILLLMESTLSRRTYDKTLEVAKKHEELFKYEENNVLFERLTSRAHILSGHQVNLTLKPDSIENLFIIAQQQYLNGDTKESANTLALHKGLKYNYDMKSEGEDIWAALNNNLGVIYLALKKPFLASKYFQQAVKEHFKAMEGEDSEQLIACKDRSLYVFNLGQALLAANNAEGAFECLVEAARHYPNNPCIWLHLAECCVKKCCNEDNQQFSVKKFGSGPHTRILFSNDNKEKYSMSGESFAIPSLSLEFAALCLKNAETLLSSQEQPSDINAPFIQAPPGKPINWKQRCEIKHSILVLQTYISLILQDPLAALVSANELLSEPDVSNSHKAWAHIYAAEALINLDRIIDSVEHLRPHMIHELVSNLPYQMRDTIAVSVWAQAAVCHILKGDLITARKILLEINSPKVLPLQMYLEICTGNTENCHVILRKLRISNVT